MNRRKVARMVMTMPRNERKGEVKLKTLLMLSRLLATNPRPSCKINSDKDDF